MQDFFSIGFYDTLIRFAVCIFVNWSIVHFLYFRKSHRRDFYFTFVIISIAIFFLVYLMMGMDRGKATMGVGLGLFGIFSIMRYRTDTMPVREMTYLFMLIAVSVVNALGRAEYHPKADYWDGFGLVTIVFVNLVFLGMAWLFESSRLVSSNCSKYILYDNISLITPDKREELKADLEKRTGLKIACLEGIAYRHGWITEEKMRELAQPMLKNQYGQYLLKVIEELKA